MNIIFIAGEYEVRKVDGIYYVKEVNNCDPHDAIRCNDLEEALHLCRKLGKE